MTKEEAVKLGILETEFVNMAKNNNDAHEGIRSLIKAYHEELKETLIPVVYANRDRGKKHSIYWRLVAWCGAVIIIAVISAAAMGVFTG